MFYRKYLVFVDSTQPWFACCILAWWLDRLFVELGHRSVDSLMCHHNNLQYVRIHQWITAIGILVQSFRSSKKREMQLRREAALMEITIRRLEICPVFFLQYLLCVGWAGVIVCLVDVSPWLCIPIVLEYRVVISLISFSCVMLVYLADAWWYNRVLQKNLRSHLPQPI